MSNPKPIETRYKGYRFRSRLEARWGRFFDALNVPWEYEKEGYDLGDAGWYLPDFWLPEQELWVEIKGELPTSEEKRKVHLLTKQLECNGVILAGNIGKPIDVAGSPPVDGDLQVWIAKSKDARPYSGLVFIGNPKTIDKALIDSQFWVDVTLDDFACNFLPACHLKNPEYFSVPIPPCWDKTPETMWALIERDKEYYRGHYGEEHWRWDFGLTIDSCWWSDSDGKMLRLSNNYGCPQHDNLTWRLSHAYEMARSARFEHGERG